MLCIKIVLAVEITKKLTFSEGCLWNYVELLWNSLDNARSSIIFYFEMKVEVEVVVHDIRSWFTPRLFLIKMTFIYFNVIEMI